MVFWKKKHIDKIFLAYQNFISDDNFAALVTNDDVLKNNGNMAINLYVRQNRYNAENSESFEDAYENWNQSSSSLKISMNELFQILEN